nr:unnamed protein product [Callosobruchus analis]
MCYCMSPQLTGRGSFKGALCTLVDSATNRCYKIRMCLYYVIVQDRSFISALNTFVNFAVNRCYKIRMCLYYIMVRRIAKIFNMLETIQQAEIIFLDDNVETDASIETSVMDVDTFVTSSSEKQELREMNQQIDCTFDRLSTCLGHQYVVDQAPVAESMLMEPDVNDPSFEPDSRRL